MKNFYLVTGINFLRTKTKRNINSVCYFLFTSPMKIEMNISWKKTCSVPLTIIGKDADNTGTAASWTFANTFVNTFGPFCFQTDVLDTFLPTHLGQGHTTSTCMTFHSFRISINTPMSDASRPVSFSICCMEILTYLPLWHLSLALVHNTKMDAVSTGCRWQCPALFICLCLSLSITFIGSSYKSLIQM